MAWPVLCPSFRPHGTWIVSLWPWVFVSGTTWLFWRAVVWVDLVLGRLCDDKCGREVRFLGCPRCSLIGLGQQLLHSHWGPRHLRGRLHHRRKYWSMCLWPDLRQFWCLRALFSIFLRCFAHYLIVASLFLGRLISIAMSTVVRIGQDLWFERLYFCLDFN